MVKILIDLRLCSLVFGSSTKINGHSTVIRPEFQLQTRVQQLRPIVSRMTIRLLFIPIVDCSFVEIVTDVMES